LAILKVLQERQATMISILEPFLSGKEYHTAMKGFVGIRKTFLERKRRQGYNEAKEAGTVGRPRWPYKQLQKGIEEIKELLLINGMPWFKNNGTPQGIIRFILTGKFKDYGFIAINPYHQKKILDLVCFILDVLMRVLDVLMI
jgi:hypothetical protein